MPQKLTQFLTRKNKTNYLLYLSKNYNDLNHIIIYGLNGSGKKSRINAFLYELYGNEVNNKKEYIDKIHVNKPCEDAKTIISELQRDKIQKIFSLGSGIAALEYQLKIYSDLSVTVSDYNSSVIRLKKFKIFDEG